MDRLKKILIAFFGFLLLYSAVHLGRYLLDYHKSETQIKELEQQMNAGRPESTPAIGSDSVDTKSAVLPEFESLVLRNEDIVGWLKIEDTPINYPVMHTPEDAEFYLDHDFDRQENKNGLPFLDYRSSITKPTTNWMIYGHNMKNGSMFHALINYKKKTYYKDHPVIQFNTLYEKGEYEIISVFLSNVYKRDEDGFKYYQFIQADTKEEFDLFLHNVKQLALYETGTTAQYGDQLLTLSTCEYSTENGRLIVVARKR